jgi:integrase
MAMFKVRYLVAKRQKSRILYYWQPNRPLRDHGFLPRRLAERTNDLADAIREAEALNLELDAWRAGQQPVPIQPGTIPWLVKLYRSDPRYTDLATKTQRGYDQCITIIEAWSERAGHPPLVTLPRKSVKAFYRSMSATPAKASAVLRVLRLLLAFAVDEGEIERNPAEKMRLKVSAPRDQVWTPEQIEAFVSKANSKGRGSIGLAVLLGAGLGQREGDVLRLGWTQYDGVSVRLRQRKTGKLIAVPAIADLRQALDAVPRTAATIVVSETTGRPYTEDNFTHLFREIADAAELPCDLQFRDLRRTAVVFLAEAGCSIPEIAAITGHSLRTATQILETYLPRNSAMAKNAITRLEEHRARTKLEA